MKSAFAIVLLSSLLASPLAFAQTTAPAPSPEATPAPAAAAPAGKNHSLSGRRAACAQDANSKQLKGQDRKDDIQLCMSEAHTDCLKQAIAQKAVGAARKDFIKSCMKGG